MIHIIQEDETGGERREGKRRYKEQGTRNKVLVQGTTRRNGGRTRYNEVRRGTTRYNMIGGRWRVGWWEGGGWRGKSNQRPVVEGKGTGGQRDCGLWE